MFRILKNVVRVNSTEKEILLGVEFTFTLCAFFLIDNMKQNALLFLFPWRANLNSEKRNPFYI